MSTSKIASASATNAALPEPPLPGTAGRPWALLLDVDGTLLDFADDPAAVIVDPALHTLLRALHRALGGALALVSGRQLTDIDRLFGEPGWVAVGLHGLQRRDADGTVHVQDIDPAQRLRLQHAVHELAVRHPAVRVEDKGAAIALHCRQVPALWPTLQAACLALLPTLPGYELQPGNLVLEFKPIGSDKGQAVRDLLATPWGAGRRPVYLGDDLTDEHAFAVVNATAGISVRVGMRTPTLAHFTLSGPRAAHAWLYRVLATLTQESQA
jgi:trehalose 6-phosphate phosphatase